MDKRKTFMAMLGAVAGFGAGRAVDLALIGGGVATALGAVGFAGYMTLAGDHEPHIVGMEHLAIFAQPSHRGPHVETRAGVDMAPVAAIPREIKEKVEGYSLVGAKPGLAWLREGDRIFAVHIGDEPPRLGRIAAIAKRDGRWALIGEKDATLIVSGLVDTPASAGGRFDKRMIFGGK